MQTSTAGVEPLVSVAPKTVLRFSLAVVLFGASMHYLVSGRKEASLGKMIAGALLALASLACL